MRRRIAGIIALFLLIPSCAPLQQRAAFDALFDMPALSSAQWGVAVSSLRTGKVVYQREANREFVPASVMKLFTTAAALVRLGPDFRYTTALYAGGTLRDGTLQGNLVIRGSGDPSFAGRFSGEGATGVFAQWADALQRAGIREIDGDIVGDDTFFDGQYLGSGWSWDDETFGYAAQISGLSFHENSIDVEVSPGGGKGAPAVIRIFPDTRYVTLLNRAITVPADESASLHFYRSPGTNVVTVSGRIAAGSPVLREVVSVHDPALFSAVVLKEVLERKGIRVRGIPVGAGRKGVVPEYAAMRSIASHSSPPLYEIVRIANKWSKNLYAEQLFRTLGKVLGGEGSTARSSEVVKETLSRMGIDPASIAVYDGSGLSRLNLVTPLHVLSLLGFMARHEAFPYFYDSLAVSGVDGTLQERMKGSEAEGRVHAKTGYFRHVRALSGYVASKGGDMKAFALLLNNYVGPAAEARALQDGLCGILFRMP